MDSSSQDGEGEKKVMEVKTFPVPFALGEIPENITIATKTPSKSSKPSKPSKPSKEQILNQAIQYHLKGNIPEAAKCYQLFINQGFKDHRVFSNYGVILQSLGKLKEAELSYRKAIELNPGFADAHSNLGNILRDLGKLKEAELSYRKAIELNPDLAEAHSNLGSILRDLGKLKELILLSESRLESRLINQGYKLIALLDITLAHFIRGNFSETLLNLNRTNKSINRGDLHFIKGNINKKNTLVYSKFISEIYPILEKEKNNIY